jgi:hypothetical protein
MVVADGQEGRPLVGTELAPGAAMAVCVDEPGQQGVSSGPAGRRLRICPLLRKLGSLAGEGDPVAVDHHGTVGDDRLRHDQATGQQSAPGGAHLRTMGSVEVAGAVGVDDDLP